MHRPGGTRSAAAQNNTIRTAKTNKCLSLPAEIWLRIIAFLVPQVGPNASTLPYPSDDLLGYLGQHGDFPPSPNKDILALSLTCRQIGRFARQALYRAPHLPTDKSLGLLSNSLAIARNERYRPMAKEHLSFIRCLRLWDARAERPGRKALDQNTRILHYASDLHYLSMENSQEHRDFMAFLKKDAAITCQPKRLTVKGVGSKPLPFSGESDFLRCRSSHTFISLR